MHIHLAGLYVEASYLVSISSGKPPVPSNEMADDGQDSISIDSFTNPLPNHLCGFKDTLQIDPNTVLSLVAKFEGGTGRYVYHCHMLEHEDHMMMREEFIVI